MALHTGHGDQDGAPRLRQMPHHFDLSVSPIGWTSFLKSRTDRSLSSASWNASVSESRNLFSTQLIVFFNSLTCLTEVINSSACSSELQRIAGAGFGSSAQQWLRCPSLLSWYHSIAPILYGSGSGIITSLLFFGRLFPAPNTSADILLVPTLRLLSVRDADLVNFDRQTSHKCRKEDTATSLVVWRCPCTWFNFF